MHPIVPAAGLVLFTRSQPTSFLLLQHKNRWDLPKGHVDTGEELIDTALRETEEETGIRPAEIAVDPQFRFQIQYLVESEKFGTYLKSVTYFLGFVEQSRTIVPTEHIGFRWFSWPASKIQEQTIDPLLEAVKRHFDRSHNSLLDG